LAGAPTGPLAGFTRPISKGKEEGRRRKGPKGGGKENGRERGKGRGSEWGGSRHSLVRPLT